MNPQQLGGLPPQQYPNPNLPPADPTVPQPAAWTPPAPTTMPLPEQQYGQTTPHPAAQQYDFILNPEKAARRQLGLPGGNSIVGRLAIAGVVVVLLVIGLAVVMSLLNSKSSNIVALTTVAQDQTELARVASIVNNQSASQASENIGINVQLSITSANKQLLSYLATNGQKLTPKVLALKRDTRTDTQLKTAADASNFDSAYIGILQTQLADYQRDLKLAYSATTGPKGRTLLSNDYTAAGLLLQQTKQQ